MANYVANKIICSKKFFDKYLLDPYTLGEKHYENCKKEKYISFNKLFGVNNIFQYENKYGVGIYYGYFYFVKDLGDGLCEVKFLTRYLYPISAIKKALEIDHSIVWYCCEENIIYISKFIWENSGVAEYVFNIQDKVFDKWYDDYVKESKEFDDLDPSDDIIWYYDTNNASAWKLWKTDDLIRKYKKEYPADEYFKWNKKNKIDKEVL